MCAAQQRTHSVCAAPATPPIHSRAAVRSARAPARLSQPARAPACVFSTPPNHSHERVVAPTQHICNLRAFILHSKGHAFIQRVAPGHKHSSQRCRWPLHQDNKVKCVGAVSGVSRSRAAATSRARAAARPAGRLAVLAVCATRATHARRVDARAGDRRPPRRRAIPLIHAPNSAAPHLETPVFKCPFAAATSHRTTSRYGALPSRPVS